MLSMIKNLLEPKTNGLEIAELLVDIMGIKISDTTLKKEIEEHPYYPSFISISDVLNNYGIENIIARFEADNLNKLPTPFIAQMFSEKNNIILFSIVKEITDTMIEFFDPENHRWVRDNKENFDKKYSNLVLIAEAKDDAGEKNYLKKRKEGRRKQSSLYVALLCIPIIVFIMGFISFINNGINGLYPVLFSLFTLIGCFVGALLLWFELDQYNPVLQKICSAGKKINCSAILNSKASKIAGVSWSIIGFSYFTGGLLLLLFSYMCDPQIFFALLG
jgi:hypothetical protein